MLALAVRFWFPFARIIFFMFSISACKYYLVVNWIFLERHSYLSSTREQESEPLSTKGLLGLEDIVDSRSASFIVWLVFSLPLPCHPGQGWRCRVDRLPCLGPLSMWHPSLAAGRCPWLSAGCSGCSPCLGWSGRRTHYVWPAGWVPRMLWQWGVLHLGFGYSVLVGRVQQLHGPMGPPSEARQVSWQRLEFCWLNILMWMKDPSMAALCSHRPRLQASIHHGKRQRRFHSCRVILQTWVWFGGAESFLPYPHALLSEVVAQVTRRTEGANTSRGDACWAGVNGRHLPRAFASFQMRGLLWYWWSGRRPWCCSVASCGDVIEGVLVVFRSGDTRQWRPFMNSVPSLRAVIVHSHTGVLKFPSASIPCLAHSELLLMCGVPWLKHICIFPVEVGVMTATAKRNRDPS